MAERKNTAAKTVMVILAILLVVCTFAARPVQTMNTAVVQTMTVKQRRMEYKETITTGEWYSGSAAVVSIPYSLGSGLKITAIYVSDLDIVAPDDALIAFEQTSGERVLRLSEDELLSAQIAYDDHLEQTQAQYWRTEKEIRQLQDSMRYQKKAERPYTEAEIARLQEELIVLERGESDERTLLERKLASAREKYDALKALSDAGWILKSREYGFVQDVSAQTGGVYGGEEALLAVCREDETLGLLVPVEKKWLKIEQEHGVQATVEKKGNAVTAQWIGAESREDGLYARLQLPWMDGQDLIGQSRVTLNSVSTKSAYIIPKKAISEGGVFVLKQRPGYFGNEHYAALVSVQTGDESGDWIEITGGLAAGDIVVIESDRELRDGDRVMHEIK